MAVLDLEAVPRPPGTSLKTWLTCFPSFGFLLSVKPELVAAVQRQFMARDLACEAVGMVMAGHDVWLKWGNQPHLFWDLAQWPLTGMGSAV